MEKDGLIQGLTVQDVRMTIFIERACKWGMGHRKKALFWMATGKRAGTELMCCSCSRGKQKGEMAMGQNPVPPVNIPIPTKID